MVCNVIDECRCFAYSDVPDPKQTQFCAVRRGPNIVSCPSECCAGGCPGQMTGILPREPFRIIDRPLSTQSDMTVRDATLLILIMITIVFLVYT